MWWVNKFGSISGPYSDEQIEKGIRQHLFTRLHKISPDKQSWRRLEQTEFWNPTSRAPKPKPFPPEFENGTIGRVAHGHEPEATPPPVSVVEPASRVDPNKFDLIRILLAHKIGIAIAGGVCAVGLVALVCAIVVNPPPGKSPGDSSIVKAPDPFKAVLLVHTKEGSSGTAFLVKINGKKYALTNDHVVRSKFAPEMVFVDGRKLVLGEMSIARDRDLARFEIKGDDPSFELFDGLPHDNDEICVYGNAKGDDVVSHLKGFVTGVGSVVLTVNAEFVRGNSGSPILNAQKKIIGVAAFFRKGDNGKDWTTTNTSFDNVRRFGIRVSNVDWVVVDRRIYQEQCAKIEQMGIYWEYLIPYLICQDVSDEKYKTLKLVHKDIDKKDFGVDTQGFHDMLMDLSDYYASMGGAVRKWDKFDRDRSAFIKELNTAIDNQKMTLENAKKALAKYDVNLSKTHIKAKEKLLGFNAKRRDALILARDFLTGTDWQNPLMRHGYGNGQTEGSVDWYLEGIQYFLDQNAQKLKDLNKALETIEEEDNPQIEP